VEQVMVRHQERVAKWEAAVAEDEALLAQRRAGIEVGPLVPSKGF
jgi:hypothetical protein